MCELLYILQGAGSVTVANTAAPVAVLPGDSMMAPAGTLEIEADSDSADISLDLGDEDSVTFLRVMLPLRFVLQDRTAQSVLDECTCAARQVRSASIAAQHHQYLCTLHTDVLHAIALLIHLLSNA